MTWPISLGVGFWPDAAAISLMASATQSTEGSFVREPLGRNSSMTTISAASFAASSGRFALGELVDGVAALLNLVARACCFFCRGKASRFSMALFLRAFLMRRRVVVRTASWPSWRVMTC